MTKSVLLRLFMTGLVDSQCTISNCTDQVFTNNTCSCTKCNFGYYRTSINSCNRCYVACRTCENQHYIYCAHSDCHKCAYGNCTSLNCSQNSKISCPNCVDGYSLLGGRCYGCLNSGCKCSLTDNCIGCVSGRYGITCKDACPVGCKTCVDSRNCTECIQGKYGETCDKNCISSCTNGFCEQNSGLCCNDTYFQAYNDIKKTYECRRCSENCLTCKTATNCTSCKPDRWGTYCQHICTGCSTDCNDEGCISCQSGYSRQRTREGYVCIKCIGHCKSCSSDTTCDECEYGYMVHAGKCYRDNFTSCPENCKNGKCDPKDRTCIDGCLDGWSDQYCNASCLSECQRCKQVNALLCDVCKTGFHGKSCEHNCNSYCKRVEGQLICDKNSGACAYGCVEGYWGNYCTELCGKGCTGRICNDTNGECLNGCKLSDYGLRCEEECMGTCHRTTKTLRRCSEITGECIYGCDKGWYGSKCTLRCSDDCPRQFCLQYTGSCIEDHWSSKTGTDITTGLQTSSESNSTVVVALAVMTGIALLAATVAISCSVIQVKKRLKDDKEITSNTCSNIVQGQEFHNNEYQDLSREEADDGPYGPYATINSEYINPV